ncbi:hypothetical protein [Aliivibrio fischeri]|nr:hypothetical protein [Aliivibrio fischeri]
MRKCFLTLLIVVSCVLLGGCIAAPGSNMQTIVTSDISIILDCGLSPEAK